MSTPPRSTADLQTLVRLFYRQAEQLAQFTEVEADQIPQPSRKLLAHNEHMTVTVESFHHSPVDVDVLETTVTSSHYSRKILLRRQTDGRVVQFGIVRLDFRYLGNQIRQEIEAQQTPLGRILIEHNVLREVQLISLWRIAPGPELSELLQLDTSTVYGRTALIYCNGEPAVELLEIVTPQ